MRTETNASSRSDNAIHVAIQGLEHHPLPPWPISEQVERDDSHSAPIIDALREQLQSKDRQIQTLETQLDRKNKQIETHRSTHHSANRRRRSRFRLREAKTSSATASGCIPSNFPPLDVDDHASRTSRLRLASSRNRSLSPASTSSSLSGIRIRLDDFQDPQGWMLAGRVEAGDEPRRWKTVESGTSLLINGAEGKAGNLQTILAHGDAIVEVEFTIPQGSNSGIYLQ
jgi:hypothetical protein